MAGKLKIIPQPPIRRFGRRDSRVRRGVALMLLAVGLALLAMGWVRTCPVASGRLPERELVGLVTHGGVAMGRTGAIQAVEQPPQACPT